MSFRRDAGFLEGARAGPDAGRIGQIEILAAARALHRLAMSDQPHQRLLQALCNFRRGDDQRAAAIGDDAAIHPVQRIRNHRRVQHVLDGDDVLQHRVRIVLRVMGGRDLDPGQLFACRAVVVHVAHGTHAVDVMCGGPIGRLEIGLGAGARGGIGPVRGLPASVISAIEHLPAAMASAAWPRWTR